jgi:3-deoxy-manno-octulosonate cytidylyltransferase (CMP-KDO synthetase)
MSILIVIPARYGSTRFPGKPLLRETGKYLIQHVWEQVAKTRGQHPAVVATDDERIAAAVRSFGGTAVMTRSDHPSGTDRIAEVVGRAEFAGVEIVVNVQGDEPEIEPEVIDALIDAVRDPAIAMATVSAPFEKASDLTNPNLVKVVTDARGCALYFSRSIIPHDRSHADGTPLPVDGAVPGIYRKHLGIYAYRRDFLLTLAATKPCELEEREKLEQLRALYLGARIHVTGIEKAPHGIDTPGDYAAFLERQRRTD